MSGRLVTLKTFTDDQLIFDEDETRTILRFFWKNPQIDVVEMNNELRSFAQGLLIEAIDATYELGYVEILFRAFYFPSVDMQKILSKVARKSASHWFKHATITDLTKAKIANTVRNQLSNSFSSTFLMLLNGVARNVEKKASPAAYVGYSRPEKTARV